MLPLPSPKALAWNGRGVGSAVPWAAAGRPIAVLLLPSPKARAPSPVAVLPLPAPCASAPSTGRGVGAGDSVGRGGDPGRGIQDVAPRWWRGAHAKLLTDPAAFNAVASCGASNCCRRTRTARPHKHGTQEKRECRRRKSAVGLRKQRNRPTPRLLPNCTRFRCSWHRRYRARRNPRLGTRRRQIAFHSFLKGARLSVTPRDRSRGGV